ncbi:helix-turn-helix domain-containing protein [Microbacterium lacus]|uniref:Helix-turn-helix domain-containing protein n=1 Tax=Microbacterium lacus TaxID=415217 RepID=A0ABN2FYU1_9MICO
MQELIGRLTELDPEATETLRVVTYFDALMAAGLGVEAIVRAAAAMAGVPAGARTPRRFARFTPDGRRLHADPAVQGNQAIESMEVQVWIERVGEARPNDAMLLERFAVAAVTASRRDSPTRSSVDVAIDPTRSAQERESALGRVGLAPGTMVRVLLTPAGVTDKLPISTTTLTSAGVLSVFVARDRETVEVSRCGVGVRVRADQLPTSLRTAELAFRLTDDDTPVVDAESLGILLTAAAELLEASPPPPDVTALAQLDDRQRDVLHALVGSESVRAAAASLHMHHSTMQARQQAFESQLGYDPRSPIGRTRYELARLVLRLRGTGAG